jgi:NADH-quinone oxidoreductase subunit L
MDTNLHLWLIPLWPLFGAAINGFFGRRFPKPAVTAVALLFTAIGLGQAVWIALQFGSLAHIPHTENLAPWITFQGFTVDFSFFLDQLSLVMLLIVTGVGFLIHIYSAGYMADDPGYYRFFSYLNLFMFFMLALVLAGNYLLMFVGWEGVGLASYLLIGFYFRKDSAAQAGKKAFITNRVGDFAFLIGMFLLIKLFGTLDYTTVFNRAAAMPVETASWGVLTATALCFMVGATGKSAQIPLYVWLPDAMEGPTPVSALIHAATMVTAGIYMIARSHVIFNHAPKALIVVAIIGALTAFMAASIGIVQNDIKRVLAYSTVSQLGYMFMACGVAAYSAGIFHLMTHAFFKALLFLSAGSVIHALSGEQDMRHMGGLRKLIPWTFGVMAIATIAIAGIPPFAGFFSKDEILWRAWNNPNGGGPVFWAIGFVTALMTSFYMFRLLFMTFFGERRGPVETANEEPTGHTTPSQHPHADQAPLSPGAQSGHAIASHGAAHGGHAHGVHESPWVMLAPLVVLAVLSIVGGWIWKPAIFAGDNKFEQFLAPVFESHKTPNTAFTPRTTPPQGTVARTESQEHVANAPAGSHNVEREGVPGKEAEESSGLELALALCSVGAALAGLFLAWFFYLKRPELPAQMAASAHGLYTALVNKYWVDEAYYATLINPIVNTSRAFLWRVVDVGIIDGAVNGAGSTARAASSGVRQMQSGNIRSYAGWVAIGAALVIGYVLWRGI